MSVRGEPSRPGQLLAIAVIGIILGSLGGCGGLVGLAGGVMQGRMMEQQVEILERSGMPAEQVDRQRRMVDRMRAVTAEWLPFTATHQVLNIVASVVLLGASVMLLRWSATGPSLFVVAAAANLIVDTGGAFVGALVQRETSEMTREMMREVSAGAGAPPPPGMGDMMEGFVQASAWMGMCLAGGWVLLKLGFYVWGVVYLRKPEVRARFSAGG
jgi:hypothetical protein